MYSNKKRRAELVEFSTLLYDNFLHKIFMDRSLGIGDRNKILLYCFRHKGLSIHQTYIMSGPSKNNKRSISMVIQRLKNKKYITNATVDAKSYAAYIITEDGIEYCKQLIPSLFDSIFPNQDMVSDGYTFSLDEIIEYLASKCISISPSYWKHYLATRDINTYLLSSFLANKKYTYNTEVCLDANGSPVSLYALSLNGVANTTHPLRCDGLLTYPLTNCERNMNFFVELDTGSQRSQIIKEKIENYMEYYLNSRSFTPLSSILFSLNSQISETQEKIKVKKGSYGSKEYYYLHELGTITNILHLIYNKDTSNYTLRDTLNALQALDKDNIISSLQNLNQTVSYFSNEFPSKKANLTVSDLRKCYYNNKELTTEEKEAILATKYYDKYLTRRNLIHSAISKIADLDKYFLKGFSLYTVPNYDIDGTFPYLLPEMFQFKSKLKRMLSSLNLADMMDIPEYQPLYSVNGLDYGLRNSYTFTNTGLHVIIENITDDLGGKARISYLLNNYETAPAPLKSSKIICFLDNRSIDTVKEMYLKSKLGNKLASCCGSRCIKDTFEVMFASYDTIKTSGSLFTFSLNGDVIFKEKDQDN